MNNETDILSDLIGHYLSDENHTAAEFMTWFLNRILLEEASRQSETILKETGDPKQTYRNGYKPRTLKTKNGELLLNKPQFRYHPFTTKVFDRYSRVEKALGNVIRESYINGVSTKKVGKIIAELGIMDISPSTVSRIAGELDEEINTFLTRPIEKNVPYLFVDATYFKVRNGGRYLNKAVFIAVGINTDGNREIVGVKIAHAETESFWISFFEELKQRGLAGVQLIISDGHKGIRTAVEKEFLGASWQMSKSLRLLRRLKSHRDLDMCMVHLKRIILGKVPKKHIAEVSEMLRKADGEEKALDDVVDRLEEMKLDDAANVLRSMSCSLSNYRTFPKSHWRKIYSTNGVERINAEIKRRIRKVGAFPNDRSALRLIVSIVMDVDEDWMTGRIYLHMQNTEN
jgi:putative transposase